MLTLLLAALCSNAAGTVPCERNIMHLRGGADDGIQGFIEHSREVLSLAWQRMIKPRIAGAFAVCLNPDCLENACEVRSELDDALAAAEERAALQMAKREKLREKVATLEANLLSVQEEARAAKLEAEELSVACMDLKAQLSGATAKLAQVSEVQGRKARDRLENEMQSLRDKLATAQQEAAVNEKNLVDAREREEVVRATLETERDALASARKVDAATSSAALVAAAEAGASAEAAHEEAMRIAEETAAAKIAESAAALAAALRAKEEEVEAAKAEAERARATMQVAQQAKVKQVGERSDG